MALHWLFVLLFCFVWRTNGLYVSEDEKLVRKIRSTDDYDQLYKEHLANLKPGQVMPHRCAYTRYGCCKDGKTRAFGPNGKGCDMILCTDKYVQQCYDKKESKRLECTRLRDKKNCLFSCGLCKPPAAPLKRCLKKKPVAGCCWNGKIPLKRDKSDCPPCLDAYPKTCATFSKVAGGCNAGSFGVRNFMIKYCPSTCAFCEEASMT
ncbi:uncharacterized protein LOC116287769 isoform X1 [Actinia tenebrosa]|uniref:Uncharacterized protein LOC116287769 isoform X1 n=1 Tax=Actinia tenebrosa TaxID=6105 RepID=A0A6P8HCR1_ACTTE|nr:uncharacterized protein LOC116287769 isoform X1 [Actinia tenebrosa]